MLPCHKSTWKSSVFILFRKPHIEQYPNKLCFPGMWWFRAPKFYKEESSWERRHPKSNLKRVQCHWCCKISTRKEVSWCGFLFRYLGPGCSWRSSNGINFSNTICNHWLTASLCLCLTSFSIQIGGPHWDVPTGRRDGRVSIANEALFNLPSPFANITVLKQQFAATGLSVKDLAVLSDSFRNKKSYLLSKIAVYLLGICFGDRRTHHRNWTLYLNLEQVVQFHGQGRYRPFIGLKIRCSAEEKMQAWELQHSRWDGPW